MKEKPTDKREKKIPSDRSTDSTDRPTREKKISIDKQASNEPEVEKSIPSHQRAEVQNPLMNESY